MSEQTPSMLHPLNNLRGVYTRENPESKNIFRCVGLMHTRDDRHVIQLGTAAGRDMNRGDEKPHVFKVGVLLFPKTYSACDMLCSELSRSDHARFRVSMAITDLGHWRYCSFRVAMSVDVAHTTPQCFSTRLEITGERP